MKNWKMYPLPFDDIDARSNKNIQATTNLPVVKTATFNLPNTGATYLDMRNWGKGLVWVNGLNLGKFWSIGPQHTLYVQVEWLKKGANEIAVLELLKPGQNILSTIEKPILDALK